MAKKAKKKKHDEHIDESWLLPYSDLLTLLLALFIVLFASSSIDQAKMEQMSQVFTEIFEGSSGFMDHTSVIQNPTAITDGVSEQQAAYIQDQKELKEIQERIDNFIAVNELESTFATKITDEGLLITIRDSILFDSGKADVKQDYISIAEELSKLLQLDPPRFIVVTGHTDNVPQNNAEFRSNWELSVMRAVNLMKLIMDSNPQLDPKYFSAKGYGEYNPIASNDTEAGRAQNRRVEVLIQQLVEPENSAENEDE
ncbi:flagellar motor protein MotB [Lysinibacillus telephonicus]|uniref:Flagellar motor protein MotB n=1 Tax=Lysinibacillus telephonicus TaxID=1714840 RepID=A0A3S0I234_9BACI|nr:flagellar motor protein MotB [Lysinibacillus telephonicus]RTQ93556.1 flagellar motor protein MotB [Lysinibacillus telephonicus]